MSQVLIRNLTQKPLGFIGHKKDGQVVRVNTIRGANAVKTEDYEVIAKTKYFKSHLKAEHVSVVASSGLVDGGSSLEGLDDDDFPPKKKKKK